MSIPTSVDFGARVQQFFSPPTSLEVALLLPHGRLLKSPPYHTTTLILRLVTMGNCNRKSYIFACALLAAATGGQAQQFCSCSPTQLDFVLTLDQTCDVNGENNFLYNVFSLTSSSPSMIPTPVLLSSPTMILTPTIIYHVQ